MVKNTMKMNRVLAFTMSMGLLKEMPRAGWDNWGIDKNRSERVASHVFLTIQLAYAYWSEYNVNVDIDKVILMLAFHETEEVAIGDIPLDHELRKYKEEIGKIAVESLTEDLNRKYYIRALIREFEEGKTKEAKFAKFIDRLETDLQAKYYDEENLVDVTKQGDNPSAQVPFVANLLKQGKTFSQTWMTYGRSRFGYPPDFEEMSIYAETHNLHKIMSGTLGKAKKKVKDYLDSKKYQS